MLPRRLLSILVYTLPVTAVVLAVLAGAALLADALQDPLGGRVLRWGAALAAGVLATDLVLLTTVLGIRSLDQTPRDP